MACITLIRGIKRLKIWEEGKTEHFFFFILFIFLSFLSDENEDTNMIFLYFVQAKILTDEEVWKNGF